MACVLNITINPDNPITFVLTIFGQAFQFVIMFSYYSILFNFYQYFILLFSGLSCILADFKANS